MTGQKRPGGRSARVQQSVHRAVSELLAESERAALTVPTVAVRAGVTPSTIHRRWGSLQDLLADVAAQRLRPEAPPLDTGSLRTDLVSWTRNYQEELASPDGRLFLRDVVVGSAGSGSACRCAAATREQMEVILRRADERGDAAPTAQDVVDHVISDRLCDLVRRHRPRRVPRRRSGRSTIDPLRARDEITSFPGI